MHSSALQSHHLFCKSHVCFRNTSLCALLSQGRHLALRLSSPRHAEISVLIPVTQRSFATNSLCTKSCLTCTANLLRILTLPCVTGKESKDTTIAVISQLRKQRFENGNLFCVVVSFRLICHDINYFAMLLQLCVKGQEHFSVAGLSG